MVMSYGELVLSLLPNYRLDHMSEINFLCPTNLMVALYECIEYKGGFTLSPELQT